MYIICIESSKMRGMGHLFRALLYADYLKAKGKSFVILINNNEKAISILKEKQIDFEIVDYEDPSDWETDLIKKYNANVWLEDKFETSVVMAQNICKNNILFCAIDEFGPGAEYCDIHFAGMIYLTGHEVKGKKKYCGPEYVILNPEIDRFKRLRCSLSNIIVSLGGSDPYGMTVKIVEELCKTDINATIVIGPSFDYISELKRANKKMFPVLQNVPSLIEEFSKYDFAITGGGVTCCEANSCGIPCMILANAPHEMKTGHFMEEKGGAIYAGSYKRWNQNIIHELKNLDIQKMSKSGMNTFDTKAIKRIFDIIEREICK